MNPKPLVNRWREYGKHEILVNTNHDEIARLDFMANFFMYLRDDMVPNHKKIYEKKVKKNFQKKSLKYIIQAETLVNHYSWLRTLWLVVKRCLLLIINKLLKKL